MATKLVIVESPAKARTIKGYLGSDYDVEASIGHIRDLMPNGKTLPAELRKKWWSDYAVDVDNNFEPYYEVPPEKVAQVKKLRDAMKGKDTLVLATDEDREGEAISWHLLEVLKPNKNVTVKRIAFHEITKDAILAALGSPRKVDECLVEAQETRRILDRLYGYTLSPVLWTRVTKNLSAGRVQSPAVKLIVDRELARRNFRVAGYWDLKAVFSIEGERFSGDLKSIDAVRVASGADFDDTNGMLKSERKDKVVLLDEPRAKLLADVARGASPYTVTRLDVNEGSERPAAPFMTTSLQQDANRKFGYSADRTMKIAQTLYEGIELQGETTGLITYMRTDSLTLSADAVSSMRKLIGQDYSDCLPDKPVHYTSKVKNAQEAHEAIRPTDIFRRPRDVARFLNEDQNRLYTLIWQRSVACQMKPAKVLRTEAEISVDLAPENRAKTEATRLGFLSTGKQILFEGYLKVYSEGRDDEAADPSERRLPNLAKGVVLKPESVDASGHTTKPPARYTDATLIKKLEEQGIGRPSTYASIISVIVDRGYVRKAAKQLVPTFKAFLTMEVLETNFNELMDLGFTAKMDEALDEISEGKADSKAYLHSFFMGDDDKKGLKPMVDERKKDIPYPVFTVGLHPETGEQMVVRTGKDGRPFLQIGEGDAKRYTNVPEELAPADLTIEKAVELLETKAAQAEVVGIHQATGKNLLLKNRQGFYLEVERTAEEIEQKVKPIWISVPPSVDPRELSETELHFICSLPLEVGKHPETSEPIFFKLGKFGAYLESGVERRTVEDWKSAEKMTVDQAVEILKLPKFKTARSAPAALKDFGTLEGAPGPVRVLSGRFGPYVTDGETNATLPRGSDPAQLEAADALSLLKAKRDAGPSTRFAKKKPASAAKKPKAAAAKKK